MKVDLFDYELPPDYIAQSPIRPRDAARLLDLTKGQIVDRFILDLPTLLNPGDLIIANNTRVMPTSLTGCRGKANINITLHKRHSTGTWLAFARPAKRVKPDDEIIFNKNLRAKVIARIEGEILLDFQLDDKSLITYLHEFGRMPLPPYLKRSKNLSTAADQKDYQSIFAKHEGAVAAPTANLHFTRRLIKKLEESNVTIAYVTLHVGAGTFLPIKASNTTQHKMHSEWAELNTSTASLINKTKARDNRIIALGTTSLRVLETAARNGIARAFSGDTDLFITPGFNFKLIDMLITNFHLPKSTLMMLVSALAGRERILEAYDHAKTKEYRFFSYGDACLIDKYSSSK